MFRLVQATNAVNGDPAHSLAPSAGNAAFASSKLSKIPNNSNGHQSPITLQPDLEGNAAKKDGPVSFFDAGRRTLVKWIPRWLRSDCCNLQLDLGRVTRI
jgi:hypothetical protein